MDNSLLANGDVCHRPQCCLSSQRGFVFTGPSGIYWSLTGPGWDPAAILGEGWSYRQASQPNARPQLIVSIHNGFTVADWNRPTEQHNCNFLGLNELEIYPLVTDCSALLSV